MSKKAPISIVIFLSGMLCFTARDYLIHSVLYGYGLQFSYDWANVDWLIYAVQFQLLCVAAAYIARSIKFFIVYEAFVMSATQDLFFFGVWNHGVFPSGDWTWMPAYNLFGTWTTLHQILLSVLFISGSLLLIKISSLIWRQQFGRHIHRVE